MVSFCALEFMIINPIVSIFANYILDNKGLKLGVFFNIKSGINKLCPYDSRSQFKNAHKLRFLFCNNWERTLCYGKHFYHKLSC